jgi:hypothetical protein
MYMIDTLELQHACYDYGFMPPASALHLYQDTRSNSRTQRVHSI